MANYTHHSPFQPGVMDKILNDLDAKSKVLYKENKFREVEDMMTSFIKNSGECGGIVITCWVIKPLIFAFRCN